MAKKLKREKLGKILPDRQVLYVYLPVYKRVTNKGKVRTELGMLDQYCYFGNTAQVALEEAARRVYVWDRSRTFGHAIRLAKRDGRVFKVRLQEIR